MRPAPLAKPPLSEVAAAAIAVTAKERSRPSACSNSVCSEATSCEISSLPEGLHSLGTVAPQVCQGAQSALVLQTAGACRIAELVSRTIRILVENSRASGVAVQSRSAWIATRSTSGRASPPSP